jgi:hypothetical protein
VTLADLYGLGVVHWLTDGMTNISLSCFPYRLAHCVWNLFCPRLVHRLAYRVTLLACLIYRLAHCVWNLFCPRLVHRLAYRVALLAGLIHRFAHCVWNLFCPRLVHRLAYRVRNCSCTSLPDRLADCVLNVPVALLLLIASAVDFLLLNNLFTYGFVTGVLFLFVNNILDEPRTTA